MLFGCSFTWQRCFGGLRTQTYENGFQNASFWNRYRYYLCENYKNMKLWKLWCHVHPYYVFSLLSKKVYNFLVRYGILFVNYIGTIIRDEPVKSSLRANPKGLGWTHNIYERMPPHFSLFKKLDTTLDR